MGFWTESEFMRYLIYLKVFGVLPLQRHPSPLSGSIWSFHYFIIFHLYFFLSMFSLIFLSYHCSLIFSLSLSFFSWFFFTFQHSLGCFWLDFVVHSTSLVAFSFSYYFHVLRTRIEAGVTTQCQPQVSNTGAIWSFCRDRNNSMKISYN